MDGIEMWPLGVRSEFGGLRSWCGHRPSVDWLTVHYLSDAWFEAASAALGSVEAGDVELVVHQRITGSAEPTGYSLVLEGGRATIDRAGHRTPHVTISQSRETADAIRAGDLNALDAIQSGALSIDGDPKKLIAAAEVLAAIDALFSALETR